jgi:hypothetical protein
LPIAAALLRHRSRLSDTSSYRFTPGRHIREGPMEIVAIGTDGSVTTSLLRYGLASGR